MTSPLVRQLLDAGVHFGHQTKRWNPKMKPFIFGKRSGIYIIDLQKTEIRLKAACDFLEEVAAKGHYILFVGTKKQAKALVVAAAKRSGMPYVINRWLGGTLTNFQTIKRNIDLLRDLRDKKASGYFDQLSKKEAKRLQRQLDKLESNFSGLVEMDRLPACLFVVDTKREQLAVQEANRLGIPVVAICDTNADPDLVEYPIPSNDDAIRAVRLIIDMAAERVVTGRRHAIQAAETGKETPEAAGAETPAPTSAVPVAPPEAAAPDSTP